MALKVAVSWEEAVVAEETQAAEVWAEVMQEEEVKVVASEAAGWREAVQLEAVVLVVGAQAEAQQAAAA